MEPQPAFQDTHPSVKLSTDLKDSASKRLEILLAVESQALRAKDRRVLRHVAVNETRKLIAYGHGIFFTRSFQPGKDRYIAKAISSQGIVDRTSPWVRWIENQLQANLGDASPEAPLIFELRAEPATSKEEMAYPFQKALWLPLNEQTGLLLTRIEDWKESDVQVLSRLSEVYDCSWRGLAPVKRKTALPKRSRRMLQASGLALLAGLFWPVSMTTLAPAKIVPANPQIIAAPSNGVIESLNVSPNSIVKPGDLLATYVDTETRNQKLIAEEEVFIAKARLDRTAIAAMSDTDTKRDIRVVESELALAERRRSYAEEQLAKTELFASMDGVVLVTDPNAWTGRPVSIGERIMMIADPNQIEVRLDAPISDGELLKPGARIRLFLDSKPMQALEGELRHANYFPDVTPEGSTAYLSFARLSGEHVPRLGARGVAKIYGERTPFIFWVMRKPFVSVRQFLGL